MGKTNRKLAQVKEKANMTFLQMTSEATDALYDMMMDTSINPLARVQAIALILDRGLGKAEESIKIENNRIDPEEARARLEAIATKIRKELHDEENV
jgi:hypothetical protein